MGITQGGAFGINQSQAGSQRNQGGVDMPGEHFHVGYPVDPVVRVVTSQPFDAGVIGYHGFLNEKILAKTGHIGGIKQGFGFCNNPVAVFSAVPLLIVT